MTSRVSRRYARALFELARDRKSLDRVELDMFYILEIYQQSPQFSQMLDSPVISETGKHQVLTELFQGNIHPDTFSFLSLLLKKHREGLLRDIIHHFLLLMDESRGIMRGHLQSAYPLNEQQRDALKKKLDRITGKNVVLEMQVDAFLLGGFVVRLDDTVIDHSLRNQLGKLRENMLLNG